MSGNKIKRNKKADEQEAMDSLQDAIGQIQEKESSGEFSGSDAIAKIAEKKRQEQPEVEVKIKEYKKLTADETNDIEFLTKLTKLYETTVADYDDNDSYIRLTKRVSKLKTDDAKREARIVREQAVAKKKEDAEKARIAREVAALEKKKALLEKGDMAEKANAARVEHYREEIKKEDWYYSKKDNKFFRKEEMGVLETMSWYPVVGVFKGRVTEKESVQWWEAMEIEGRMKDCVVNTTRDFIPKTQFNAIDKSEWLQPSSVGEENEWIRLLVRSLSNGNEKMKEYIEHIVAYKYLHPEDYKIPCLWFYGEGGAGKNTFVQQLLATIFSVRQVVVVDGSVFEGKNGQLLGKVVSMLDESKVDKKTFNHFKRWVGNKTIFIDQKYGGADTYEHTLLWIAGGNGFDAAPPLTNDTSARRWAPIRVDKNIMEYVSEEYGVSYDKTNRKGGAVELYAENEKCYTDREIVAKWLMYIIEKHGAKGRPPSLVTDDMADIARAHNAPHDNFFEEVFESEEGEFIYFKPDDVVTSESLHYLYTRWLVERYPRGMAINEIHFGRMLVDWVRQNQATITKVKVITDGGRRKSGWAMADVKQSSFSVTCPSLLNSMKTVSSEILRENYD